MRLAFPLVPALVFVSACTAAATPAPYPTSTPYPPSTPYATPEPAGTEFLETLQAQILVDDFILLIGREAVLAQIGGEPTFAFIDDPGPVLHYRTAVVTPLVAHPDLLTPRRPLVALDEISKTLHETPQGTLPMQAGGVA